MLRYVRRSSCLMLLLRLACVLMIFAFLVMVYTSMYLSAFPISVEELEYIDETECQRQQNQVEETHVHAPIVNTNHTNIPVFKDDTEKLVHVVMKTNKTFVIEDNKPDTQNLNKPEKKNNRKLTKRERQLINNLKTQVEKLKHCHVTESDRELIKRKLNTFMEQTPSVLTQKNTHVRANLNEPQKFIEAGMWQLLPETSPLVNQRFSTCAIIGNGGILKGSKCGNEIDRHSFVIRSNLPPIAEFTVDAGRKTNLTSLCPTSKTLAAQKSGTFDKPKFLSNAKSYQGYILWIQSSNEHPQRMPFTVTEFLQKETPLQVLLSNPEYSRKFQDYWKNTGKVFSTEMTLISMGLSMCDQVDLYGFWPYNIDNLDNVIPREYFENSPLKRSKTHDYTGEFVRLLDMQCKGLLKLQLGKCTA
ncbi:alpha-N-acetylneuraminide alpha-2,8-sialyltransferase-like [Saccoglossus kowalevskii]|uniref:Sia-alpha-2,3-Gal-beta-1,4-GlcNAc-R:alpha 2,8-sialyltransferase-like n=1 Tax=Saccoglossus kowalevskii TaxID=10224 RepID=A0ABM0MCN1_SACKO|nr:PREDICTED: sia-alpha-2,3-Gal-beta-1,4-GlcNAc-R:alpha 2,8-sialyltransferase-like [Saccoglossus kowalevskii]